MATQWPGMSKAELVAAIAAARAIVAELAKLRRARAELPTLRADEIEAECADKCRAHVNTISDALGSSF